MKYQQKIILVLVECWLEKKKTRMILDFNNIVYWSGLIDCIVCVKYFRHKNNHKTGYEVCMNTVGTIMQVQVIIRQKTRKGQSNRNAKNVSIQSDREVFFQLVDNLIMYA